MPKEDVSTLPMRYHLSEESMDILRRGHIPESQEDHWFIYCDYSYIRYYRSWTGMCAFEAHFAQNADGFVIDSLTVNHALCQFGVNCDALALCLFLYLIIAEQNLPAEEEWNNYCLEWLNQRLRDDKSTQ